MIIPSWIYFGYFLFFLAFVVISFYLLLQTNFEKLFKQGKIFAIRCSYFILSLILSFLTTTSIFALITAIYNFVINQ
jgi:uncharacterized membrane protein YwzB